MTVTIGSKESVNLHRLMEQRKVGEGTSHREDYLESAYWHFDESRKSIGERLAFKASLRGEIKALEEEFEVEGKRVTTRLMEENTRLQNLIVEVTNLMLQHIEGNPTSTLLEIGRKLSDAQYQ